MNDNIKTIKFNVTEAEIAKLRSEFDPSNLPESVDKGSDAYQQVHQAVMRLTSFRTGIEARRKELKADALEWGRKVDRQAKELTAKIEEIEAPWKDLKAEADDRKKREEEEARRLEQARIDRLEGKVLALQWATEGLLNASAAQIESRLDTVKNLSILEDEYEEYYEAAIHHQSKAVVALQQAYDAKVAQEEQAAALKQQEAQAAALKQQQEAQAAVLKQQQEKLEEEQREFQRQQAEAKAKQEAATEDEKPANIAPDLVEQEMPETEEPPAEDEPTDPEQAEFVAWWNTAATERMATRRGGEAPGLWVLRVAFTAWKAGAANTRNWS